MRGQCAQHSPSSRAYAQLGDVLSVFRLGQRFSKDVRRHFAGRAVAQVNHTAFNFLSDEVAAQVEIFRALVILAISRDCDR